jgi:hypothetical protein
VLPASLKTMMATAVPEAGVGRLLSWDGPTRSHVLAVPPMAEPGMLDRRAAPCEHPEDFSKLSDE